MTAGPRVTRRERAGLYLVWILVIVSLLAWRSGSYSSGGVDPVVVAKGFLTGIAFLIVLVRFLRAGTPVALGVRTPLLVFAYIAATWVGGLAGGTAFSSGILGLRVLLTAAAVGLTVLVYPVYDVLQSLVTSLAAVGVLLALSGVHGLAAKGRLYATLLPVNPNQVALLLGPPAIWLVWRMLQAPCRLRDLFGVLTLTGLAYLTGSRTGLIAVAVAVVIVLAGASKIPKGGFVCLLALIPGIFYVVAFTGVVARYVYRGTSGNVTTLNSRTIAWDAVLQAPVNFWQQWFGGGLAVKTVGVSGQYWSQQVLDSSWVSAYAQAGLVGVITLGLWAVTAVVSARRAPRPYRSVLTALVVYALIRSGLENGLLDSYVLFVTMLVPTLVSELVDRQTGASPLAGAVVDRRIVGDLCVLPAPPPARDRVPVVPGR